MTKLETVVMREFNTLSDAAKETAKEMIRYCIDHGLCMGMDEGFKDFKTEERHEFVRELQKFIGA